MLNIINNVILATKNVENLHCKAYSIDIVTNINTYIVN
jgi:hypothetical protein